MKKANTFVRVSKLSAISLFITLLASCGGKDSSSSADNSSNNSDNNSKTDEASESISVKDIVGDWVAYGDTPLAQQKVYMESTLTFYEEGSFSYIQIVTDYEDQLVFSIYTDGEYTLNNNVINYNINKDLTSVEIGSSYVDDEEYESEIKDLEEDFLTWKSDKIISFKKSKNNDDPDEMSLKDNNGIISTWVRYN